ncbi:hypothetical protein PABG_07299 [Paracoccidioides brasiliensis Pb03]|nr:hypothetical protein PABG_07299 [Paracoccidioides brasiliensis Pb03]
MGFRQEAMRAIGDKTSPSLPLDAASTKALERLRGIDPKDRLKFVIFRITGRKKESHEIVVDVESAQGDYEEFREKLLEAKDEDGNHPGPRYGVFSGEFDLGSDGKRNKIALISWVPEGCHVFYSMLYGSALSDFKKLVNPQVTIQTDDKAALEWKEFEVACIGKQRG